MSDVQVVCSGGGADVVVEAVLDGAVLDTAGELSGGADVCGGVTDTDVVSIVDGVVGATGGGVV